MSESTSDLESLRERLERLDDVAFEERAALFEDCHGALVAELNRLEEVS